MLLATYSIGSARNQMQAIKSVKIQVDIQISIYRFYTHYGISMATSAEVIEILEHLSEYYDRTLTNPQVRVYVRHLSGLHIYSLKHAARERINTSPFFPKVSELRETAARFPPPEPDPLWDELQSLKQKFFTGGGLDLAAWSDLEQRLSAAHLIGYAHYLRDTLRHLQTDYDENGNYLDEAKDRYLEWENLNKGE